MDPDTLEQQPRPHAFVPTDGTSGANEDRLESWAQVAGFLACNERTAMRWESKGLPVHRTTVNRRIWASRAELSRWLEQHPERS